MKKIGCITFHSAHNYGSVLQALALQEFIKGLGDYDYSIINLRTQRQKQFYLPPCKKSDAKSKLKSLMFIRYKKDILTRHKKFENFITHYLNTTTEINDINQLKVSFDTYISGSDQIWNLYPLDFDWAYYLGFTPAASRRISYAPSFGPKDQNLSDDQTRELSKLLVRYSAISVRDKKSQSNVKNLTKKEPQILIDPVMLLDGRRWSQIIKSVPLIQKNKYIFLYDLKGGSASRRIAQKLSRNLGLPIVICKENKSTLFMNAIRYFDAGPLDFLKLISNAELVLSSSFHGNVFAILFNRPFFAINGLTDNRINTLLKLTGFENRSVSMDNINGKIPSSFNLDFEEANRKIALERKKSKEFLLKNL